MATSISSSFAGKAAADFISASVLEATTLSRNLVKIYPNVKYKEVIRVASNSNAIQSSKCDFTALGDISIAEKILEPVKLMINLKDCKDVLEKEWESENMRPGAKNSSWTKNFTSWVQKKMQDDVAIGVDQLMWQGATGGTSSLYIAKPFLTETSGYVARMLADSDVIDVTGTTISSANILTEIAKVYAAIPDTIVYNPDLKFYVSRATLRAYQTALPQTFNSNSNFDITKPQSVYFNGIELVAVPIADNKIVATYPNNLGFATDLLSDHNEFSIIEPTDGSRNLLLVARFSVGVNHFIGSEIVLYS